MDFFGILFDIKNGSKMPYSKNYFDTLFAAKLEELGVKTITGTLPLTFTAKAGAADTWTIYGNDENGENLFNGNYKTASISVPSAGTYVYQEGARNGKTAVVEVPPSATITIKKYTSSNRFRICGATSQPVTGDTISYIAEPTADEYTFTTDSTTNYLVIMVSTAAEGATPDMCVVKGSTAPDHYIPYQQGVGERTENLFNFQQFADGTQTTTNGGLTFTRDNDTIVINNSSTATYPEVYLNSDDGSNIPVLEATTYNAQLYVEDAPQDAEIYVDIYGKDTLADSWHYMNIIKPQNRNITLSTTYAYYSYLLIAKGKGITYSGTKVRIQIIKGSTAPTTYIPYGYQIPLIVSQDGQTDKTVDIYIGDSPLTGGKTVSKTSTGVDLELFEGSNTVSTTLYNKPTMTITYK